MESSRKDFPLPSKGGEIPMRWVRESGVVRFGVLAYLILRHCLSSTLAIDPSLFREGFGGRGGNKAIGCPNIGMLWGDMDDLDEESCQEYVRLMSRPFLPRGGETRHPRLIAHQNSTAIVGDVECSGRGWLLAGKERWCSCFYDAAGETCADESPRAGRRPKGAITYLLYGSARYLEALEASILHITASFLNQFPYYDILVFHSPNFSVEPEGSHQTSLQILQVSVSTLCALPDAVPCPCLSACARLRGIRYISLVLS